MSVGKGKCLALAIAVAAPDKNSRRIFGNKYAEGLRLREAKRQRDRGADERSGRGSERQRGLPPYFLLPFF
jgi:hypothetical protein